MHVDSKPARCEQMAKGIQSVSSLSYDENNARNKYSNFELNHQSHLTILCGEKTVVFAKQTKVNSKPFAHGHRHLT